MRKNIKMTTKQAVSILKKYNKWLRVNNKVKMPDPTQIGIAIDIVVEQLELRDEFLKLAHKERFKDNNYSPF
jgi:hypothetical protein